MTDKERQDLEQEYNSLKTKTENARFVDPADIVLREIILALLMKGGVINGFVMNALKENARWSHKTR